MSFPFSVFRFSESDEVNLTAFIDGQMYSATDSHPNFARIQEMCQNGDETVINYFDISHTAQERFRRLSERVTVSNGKIYFDGEEVDNSLTQQVVRFINDGVEDFNPLIQFFEKVQTNPNPHSREQLYRWLADRDFTINQDGNIVAYKGVKTKPGENGTEYFSIHHGTAIVDGLKVNGAIPNNVGSVIEMPRSDVQHDPSRGCHTGLHAGTWNYASDFADGAVLTIEINPRDVVSVPTDCFDQKMRVCRYTVTGVTEQEMTTALQTVDTADVDEYDEEEAGFRELDSEDEVPYKFDSHQPYTQVGWLSSTYDPDDPEAPWNA
jgi:hypothetical protein